jgi:hypothetical protein
MSVEKYQDVTTKLLTWSKLKLVGHFVEKVLDLLKDGALVAKFEISVFTGAVKSIQDLQTAVEAKYVEQNEGEEGSELTRKRDAELKECPRTRLRNECVKMLLAVTALSLPLLNPGATE